MHCRILRRVRTQGTRGGTDSGIKIESGVPALVTGDATRISQILHNLVGNALKFTDRGRITVTVTCARGEPLAEGGKHRELRVFFAIADTGIGLPADKIGELFKPCELMGGTISVESRLY
jgi:signal transduction histidine kinase